MDDRKTFKKNNPLLLLIFYMLKKYVQLLFQKVNNSFKDSKWRKLRLALSCGKETIYIKRSNIKTSWWFLLFELSSFFFLTSFRSENKLKSHEKNYKIYNFCGIVMPSEKYSILNFNQYMKPDKMPYIIYADIESLIKNRWMCL